MSRFWLPGSIPFGALHYRPGIWVALQTVSQPANTECFDYSWRVSSNCKYCYNIVQPVLMETLGAVTHQSIRNNLQDYQTGRCIYVFIIVSYTWRHILEEKSIWWWFCRSIHTSKGMWLISNLILVGSDAYVCIVTIVRLFP